MVFGGIGVAFFNKVIDLWQRRNQKIEEQQQAKIDGNVAIETKRIDDATLIRTELRARVSQLEISLTEWQTKYFDKEAAYNKLQAEFDEYRLHHP